MATIQKGAKINFYKFVQVQSPTSSAVRSDESAALAKTINTNTQAVNNLGATVNSIGKILASVKKASILQLEMEEKNRKKFQAEYTKELRRQKKSAASPLAVFKKPSFLEGLFNFLSGLIKAAIIIPALKWLSDPENREKVERIIEIISKVATFIFDVAKFGVVNTIEGLYTLLSDESSPWEKVGGLVRGLVGLGTLLLGIRWLSNPANIIKDFGDVLKFFRNNLKDAKTRLGMGLGAKVALGTVATVAVMEGVFTASAADTTVEGNKDMPLGITPGTEGIGPVADGGRYGQVLENIQESKKRTEEFKKQREEPGGLLGFLNNIFKSNGGKIPQAAQGGWISGPQSGYPVSLDGGRSTSFIGHGTEYVARKANGGAFVVPFNTPGTKTQPHLTQKRIGEAKSLGFNVPGFSSGGSVAMTETQKKALGVLAKYESGADGYNAVNQYGDKGGRGNKYYFPDGSSSFAGDFRKMSMHGGKALTDLSVQDVLDLQYDNGSLSMRQWVDQGKLHAVGRYQFIGNTLPGLVNRSNIPRDAKFDKRAQDILALQLMKERGISPWVGPSDKATQAERAVVQKARRDPIPTYNYVPTAPTASARDYGNNVLTSLGNMFGLGGDSSQGSGSQSGSQSKPEPEPKKDKGNWFQQFWRGLTGNEFGSTSTSPSPLESNQSTLKQDQERREREEKEDDVASVSDNILTLGNLMPKGASDARSIEEIMGVDRKSMVNERKEKRDLKKATEQRNKAKKKVRDKSQDMIKTAITAIAEQNGLNSQAIAAAQQAVQLAMGNSGNSTPQPVGGGSARNRSVASRLQSSLNLLGGILR